MTETISKYDARRHVSALIVSVLGADPDAMPDILAAITEGMRAAIHEANERAAQKDRAMLAALGLALPQRVDAETRAMLSGIVADGCNRASPCALEIRALDLSTAVEG